LNLKFLYEQREKCLRKLAVERGCVNLPKAQEQKVGLWSDPDPVPPWVFRSK